MKNSKIADVTTTAFNNEKITSYKKLRHEYCKIITRLKSRTDRIHDITIYDKQKKMTEMYQRQVLIMRKAHTECFGVKLVYLQIKKDEGKKTKRFIMI